MIRITLIALALFVACGLAACNSQRESNAEKSGKLPVAPVGVQTVQSKPIIATEDVVGTVRAKRRATLESRLSARIADFPVALGQSVRVGQMIARLDTADISARLEQAQASFEQAERDWKRTSMLFGQQAATRAEYDTAQSRYEVAKGAAAEAKAMMSYSEVVAPFDSVVAKKWMDTGDFAAPGKPLISLEDPSLLQMEADVPQAIASNIEPGDHLAVQVDGIGGELTGIVREIAPAGDPLTRTFRVKLDLPEQPGLKSGQFARLHVPVGESRSLRVPASAVVQRGQLEIVFTISAQKAQLHLVRTGKRIGDEMEILSGLDADARVVVEGAVLLTDGQPVSVK